MLGDFVKIALLIMEAQKKALSYQGNAESRPSPSLWDTKDMEEELERRVRDAEHSAEAARQEAGAEARRRRMLEEVLNELRRSDSLMREKTTLMFDTCSRMSDLGSPATRQ